MNVCFFGDYDPEYNRVQVILKGMRRIGAPYVEVRRRRKGVAGYYHLWRAYRQIGEHDIVVVLFGDARLMPVFAKCIVRKPVVWDPLYSLYDNWVYDRKLVRPHSLKAYYYWLIDWLGCVFSDLVFLDTETNAEYFRRTFRQPKEKIHRLLVGADDDTFTPAPFVEGRGVFEVEFHGKYIPVQGTDVIVRAAKLLEQDNVHFTLIGSGQEAKRTRALAAEIAVSNITFLPFLPREQVREYIRTADVCIGLVGNVPRVVRAIPNKMYEAAAMGRVSINADTSSLREVFTPGVDSIGVVAGDAEDIARTIRELKQSRRAKEMGEKALMVFKELGAPEKVAQDLEKKLRFYKKN